MPTDVNGVYSLPAGYLAVTGQTIQPSQHNPPLEDIASALTARLSANGANPMTGGLKAIDGAVGTPSYTFNSAQTSGFYLTAGGNIGVSIAGAETVEFGPSGIVKGGKLVGELFIWTGLVPPALSVMPYGQTLSRATYADLWTHAQAQIALGNTFYNNGNGTTTFGIADMRGRAPVAWDSMGGTSSNRVVGDLTNGLNGDTMGATGGSDRHGLLQAQLPAVTPVGTISVTTTINGSSGLPYSAIAPPATGGGAGQFYNAAGSSGSTAIASSGTFSGTPFGGNEAHNNMMPCIIVNFALFAGV